MLVKHVYAYMFHPDAILINKTAVNETEFLTRLFSFVKKVPG